MTYEEKSLEHFKSMETERLLEMVKYGQITLMTEEGRNVAAVMSAHLVNTSEADAWSVLLNYDAYCRFLPGISTSKVLARCDKSVTVRFEAGVKVMGVGGAVKYTYRMEIAKPYVNAHDAATGEINGYWAILPTPDKNQIIVVHAGVAKDVSTINMFLRFLVEKLPAADIALNISPITMLVNRMKHRMEQEHGKHT